MDFPNDKELRFILQLVDFGYSAKDKEKIMKDFNLSVDEADIVFRHLQRFEPGIECDY